MKHSHNFCQSQLFNFESLGFNIKDDPLVKITDQMDWPFLCKKIETLYSNKGRNSNSIRLMLGLEMAKTYYGVSDQEIVRMLKTNISLMYFCGYTSPISTKEIPSSSSMTNFRSKLTQEILDQMMESITKKIIVKLPPRKRTSVNSDTTVTPQKIKYPTDADLLHTASKKLVDLIQQKVIKVVIKGKHKINKLMRNYGLLRKKSKELIEGTKETLIKYVESLNEIISNSKKRLNAKQEEVLAIANTILSQQKELLDGKTIQGRIVSFHENKIRPIFRGKAGHQTEFGVKVSLMTIGQYIVIPNKIEYENYSDTEIPQEDIQRYERITGRKIKEYSFDRGGHSPQNHKLMEDNSILDGIQYRGKLPNGTKPINKTTGNRLYRQRSAIEGKIGTLKSRWGCKEINYKSSNAKIRINMACLMHNLKWYIG